MSSPDVALGASAGGADRADGGPGAVPLSAAVERALRAYLAELQGQATCDLYQQVLAEMEEPLLRVTMESVGGNQCRAAEILGLSRGTLRKKLKKHGLL